MVYKWRVPVVPVDAQIAGQALEDIEKKHGRLEPKTIVQESQGITAPLHMCFEWDNDIAGPKYREVQARKIIQNIVVVQVKDKNGDELPPVRAFVSVTENATNNRQREYKSINIAVNNNAMNDSIMRTAMMELKSFEYKYANLTEFSDVIRAIQKTLTKINKTQNKLANAKAQKKIATKRRPKRDVRNSD